MGKRKGTFETLAELRGARIVKGAFEVGDRARTWQVRLLSPAGRGQPSRLGVRLSCGALPTATMRRETRLDELGKRLKINRELQTGDLDFDARVYIESDVADRVLLELAAMPGFREAVRALVDGGWVVSLGPQGLEAMAAIQPDARALNARLEAALEPLAALAQACERFPRGAYRMLPGRHRPAVFAALASASGVAGMFGLIWGEDRLQLVDETPVAWAALAGLLLWPASVALLGLLVRGRSTSFRFVGVSSVMLLFGTPVSAMGGLLLANGCLDGSPATEHRTTVTAARVLRGKNVSYLLSVASWAEGRGSLEMRVSKETFRQVGQPGTPVVLRTREGALGLPWIEAVQAGP